MPSWLLSSLLVGGLLATAECVFIVLTCGPFWLGLDALLKTWLIYSLLSLLSAGVGKIILALVPPLRRRFTAERSQFLFAFISGWLAGGALLVFLVAGDSYAGSEYPLLGLIIALTGVLVTLGARALIPSQQVSFRAVFILPLFLMTFLLISWASNQRFSGRVSHRNQAYGGDVPHVCLLIMDTVRRDHLSCYGYANSTSPNIDRLAGEGLRCRNAFSAANWTPPGHISIFTGKYPPQHANNGQVFMPDELVSLTEILVQQGYFGVALYNNPTAGRAMNLTQGFDLDVGVYGHSWVYPAPFRLYDKIINRDSGAKITFYMAERLFRWMEKRQGHLFLYINVTEAHAPYQIHEPYFSQFMPSQELAQVANLGQVRHLCTTLDLVLNDSARFSGCNAASYAYLRAAYDSELAYLDHQIGRFADQMAASGALDRTLLAITSDHGEFLGEHYTLGHPELLLNPVLQIPLILRYPARLRPAVFDQPVSNVDVLPTLLCLAGAPQWIPPDVSGCDILELESSQRERRLMAANISPEGGCFALLEGDAKLIINHDHFLPKYFPVDTLLFDLRSDPSETQNLAAMRPQVAFELSHTLELWLAESTIRPESPVRVSNAAMANLKALGYIH